ncbi:MAG TPA: histone deacetylase family protein [Candidatus Sulfotelmatobacter sp.]|nr:histone deacetylase family protein [Candidatus Sulfotelmatobacter sp.]
MLIVHSETHRQHAPRYFLVRGAVQQNPEIPERAERLLAAVRGSSNVVVEPDGIRDDVLAAVHTDDYLAFLRDAPAAWAALTGAATEIVPNVHPNRYTTARPRGIVGRAGYHQADTSCPIGPGTFAAACAAAACAVHATRAVLGGARVAYALCRPPGHHAYADIAGGFCYLNNVAIAAALARTVHGRVAILDVDVHHGNGTQGIFYDRPDVLFVSVHADPSNYYPYFAGYADERGAGAGVGANLNLPLPHGTGDAGYLEALERGLDAIRRFAPGLVLVSLGFDASEHDPLGVLKVTRAGFAEIARRVAALALPTVLIQEGGYLSDHLGGLLVAFLGGFEAAR